MANGLVDDLFHETKKGVIIKLDLEKALAVVNWDFLDAILRAKGFGVSGFMDVSLVQNFPLLLIVDLVTIMVWPSGKKGDIVSITN